MLTALPITSRRLIRALPLAVAAGLVAYGLVASAGVLGLLLLVVILFLAGALAVWARGADAATRSVLGSTGTAALLCAPAILVVFFSFSSGGFFPDSVALGAMAVARPAGGPPGARSSAAGARSGVRRSCRWSASRGSAGWALLSQLWSHARGRATIGFDRDLLYLLTFALFASVGRTRARLGWARACCSRSR